jgi:hypothetical protein
VIPEIRIATPDEAMLYREHCVLARIEARELVLRLTKEGHVLDARRSFETRLAYQSARVKQLKNLDHRGNVVIWTPTLREVFDATFDQMFLIDAKLLDDDPQKANARAIGWLVWQKAVGFKWDSLMSEATQDELNHLSFAESGWATRHSTASKDKLMLDEEVRVMSMRDDPDFVKRHGQPIDWDINREVEI